MTLKKLIAIWGTFYCGSTLAELVLGSLPGIVTTGEPWTYLRSPIIQNESDGRMILDNPRQPLCSRCTGGCDLLTAVFIKTLTYENLYEELAELHGVETIVTADKNPWVYADLLETRHRDMIAVVLFKNPFEFTKSMMREWRGYDPFEAVLNILDTYVRIYEIIFYQLDWWNIPSVFEEYRDIAFEPEKRFRGICDFCDIEFDPSCLNFWEFEHHRVGGNYARAMKEKDIKPDDSWRSVLSFEERAVVMNHNNAWKTYAHLCSLKENF